MTTTNKTPKGIKKAAGEATQCTCAGCWATVYYDKDEHELWASGEADMNTYISGYPIIAQYGPGPGRVTMASIREAYEEWAYRQEGIERWEREVLQQSI